MANINEMMKLVKELTEFFKKHNLRDEESRKKFFRKWAIAELIAEKEAAANE